MFRSILASILRSVTRGSLGGACGVAGPFASVRFTLARPMPDAVSTRLPPRDISPPYHWILRMSVRFPTPPPSFSVAPRARTPLASRRRASLVAPALASCRCECACRLPRQLLLRRMCEQTHRSQRRKSQRHPDRDASRPSRDRNSSLRASALTVASDLTIRLPSVALIACLHSAFCFF